MTARAGTLTWDVDVGRADEAHRKIEELSRRLDAALNKPRPTTSAFKAVGEEAQRASSTVQKFSNEFAKLRAQHELGHKSSSEYRQELVNLQSSLKANSHLTDENSQKFRQLATIYGQTERELARLTREQERAGKAAEHLTREQQRVAASELRQRIQSMVNEVRLLRNEWQETGQNTEQTKTRMRELQGEMQSLRQELAQGEGGWEAYNREITQLAVAGRSAQATIDGMEGRMSRLGLASQVSLGATDALRRELGRLGPAGSVAGAGIGIISGEMQKLMELGPERLIQGITGGMFRLGAAATLAGGALAVGLSVALFKATEHAAEYAREIENATFRTGLSVEGLQELQHAARTTGVPMELLSTTMQRLQRRAADANAGNKQLRESFDRLGVSLTDTNGEMRSTEDLLEQVADGLAGVENNADRLALAFKIFDTEGGRLLPLLMEGSEGIRELREEARELGLVISGDTILSLSEFHGEIEAMKQQFQTARIEMTAAFLPVVRDMLMPLLSDRLVPVIQGLASDLSEFTDRLFDASEEGEVLRAKVGSLIAPLLGAGDIAIVAGAAVFGGIQTIATAIGLLATEVQIFIAGVKEDWRNLWIGWQDDKSPMRELWDERWGEGSFDAALGIDPSEESATIEELRAQQGRIITGYLDGLEVWGQPLKNSWARLISGGYGEGVAEALSGLAPVLREGGRKTFTELGEGAGEGLREGLRSVDEIFAELELKGITAERAAIAAGGTLEDQLVSLETRAKLIDAAIAEMMARPDILEGDNADRLTFLLNRAIELDEQIEAVQTRLNILAAPRGGVAGLPREPFTIDGITVPEGVTPEQDAALRQALGIDTWLELFDAVDAYSEAIAGLDRRIELGLVDPQDRATQVLQATRNALEGLVPAWGTLTDEQKEYVRASLGDIQDLEAEIVAAERAVEDAERRAAMSAARRASLQARDERPTVTQADIDALLERRAEQEAQRREAILAGLEAAAARTRDRQRVRDQARELGQEVSEALKDGALDGLHDLETRLVTILEEMGDDPSAAPFMGLLTLVRSGLRELEAEAIEQVRRLAANAPRAATLTLEREILTLTRRANTAIRDGTLEGLQTLERELVQRLSDLGDDPSAAPLMGLLVRVRDAIGEATAEANRSVESLQWQLVELRNQGADPTSEAVRRLVREINELQLRAALEELREKGVANLSEFAKAVLRANGVLGPATSEAIKFSDALRGLNDVSATGLADIIDGVEMMMQTAADAETVIEGLTMALEGATALVKALGEGDAFETVKAAAMIAGEAIGRAMGVPGVGGAVGAVFDLGRSIWQAISDAFTGDSPAARAIREGLTSAVHQSFAQGILLALQSGEDWHEALRENLKLAFLTSLINAFVQSAIIGPILEPIFVQYSRMVARGQWEEAGNYLASTLPGAIDEGIRAAEQFMGHLPEWLLPTTPPGPQAPEPGATGPQPTGVFELPTAAVTGIAAPDWARDLVNAGRMQLEAAVNFSQAVELLRSEGITIRTDSGAPASGGGAAAARAV